MANKKNPFAGAVVRAEEQSDLDKEDEVKLGRIGARTNPGSRSTNFVGAKQNAFKGASVSGEAVRRIGEGGRRYVNTSYSEADEPEPDEQESGTNKHKGIAMKVMHAFRKGGK